MKLPTPDEIAAWDLSVYNMLLALQVSANGRYLVRRDKDDVERYIAVCRQVVASAAAEAGENAGLKPTLPELMAVDLAIAVQFIGITKGTRPEKIDTPLAKATITVGSLAEHAVIEMHGLADGTADQGMDPVKFEILKEYMVSVLQELLVFHDYDARELMEIGPKAVRSLAVEVFNVGIGMLNAEIVRRRELAAKGA